MASTRLMHVLCALAVAALAASVHAADADEAVPARLFSDWLEKPGWKASTQSTMSPSGYYQGLDTMTTCLKEASYKNCRNITEDAAIQYWESSLACCKEGPASRVSGPGDTSFQADDVEIGVCSFQEAWFPMDDYVQVSNTAFKAGTFDVSCTLKSASPLCGAPFCEGMSVSAKGFIYLTLDVVSYTNPPMTQGDASCPLALVGGKHGVAKRRAAPPKRSREAPAKLRKRKGGSRVAAAAAAAQPADESVEASTSYSRAPAGPRTMYQSSAWIYSGPMQVHSRLYDVKLEGSYFEFVALWYDDTAEVIDEDAAADKYLVEPYTYSLKFIKEGGHPSYGGGGGGYNGGGGGNGGGRY